MSVDSFILQQNELKKFVPVLPHDTQSVRNWHQNHDWSAISKEEQQHLIAEFDLVYIVPKEKTPLRRLLDQFVTFRRHPLFKDKAVRIHPSHNNMETISYFSDQRMDRLVNGHGDVGNSDVDPASGASPEGEAWHDYRVHGWFPGHGSYATTAKPTEALGATAVHSAVLMAFMQLAGNA